MIVLDASAAVELLLQSPWGVRVADRALAAAQQAVARRARAFDMRVVYAGHGTGSQLDGPLLGCERVSLDRLLEISDVVSLHVPLTAATGRQTPSTPETIPR